MSHVDDYNSGKIDAAELNRRIEADMRKIEERRKGCVWRIAGVVMVFIGVMWLGKACSENSQRSVECFNKYPVVESMAQDEKEARWYLQDLCVKGEEL